MVFYGRSAPFITTLYVLLMLNTVGSRVLSPKVCHCRCAKLSAWLERLLDRVLYYSLLLMVVHGIVCTVLRIFHSICRLSG